MKPTAVRQLPALLLLTLLFCAAAILNRYPLVFPDTGAYIYFAEAGGLPDDRPVFYSYFIRASRLFGHLPLWAVVVAQSLLASAVILATGTCLELRSRARLLLAGLGLTLFSGLPWFTGQIMPDIFAGIGLLAAFALARCDWGGTRGLPERLFLLAMIIVACAVHFSHAAIITGSLVMVAIIEYVREKRAAASAETERLRMRRTLALAVIPLIVFGANQLWSASKGVRPSFNHFLAHRLVEDGLLQRLLSEHCPQGQYILCPYAQEVRRPYLWWQGGPFEKIGGFASPPEETRRMVLDTLRYYPAENLLAAAENTAIQLWTFQTGGELRKRYGANMGVTRHLSNLLPEEAPGFMAGRQQQDELQPILKSIRVPHTVTAVAAILYLLVVALRGRSGPRPGVELSEFVLAALLVNAAVCGVLSGPAHRYGSRIVWVAVLAAMLILAVRTRRVGFRAAFNGASPPA